MWSGIFKIFKKQKYYCLLILAIILAGIYIRTRLFIYNDSFWYDTCALGANINKLYIDLFKPLEYLQCAPPLFMVISKFIYSIFHNGNDIIQKDFLLRIIPYFSSIIVLPLFFVLIYKMFKNFYMSIVCTFLLAFNHFAIYYSREFKPYSSDLLITVVLLLVFYCLDWKQISLKKLFLVSCFMAILLWFSFPSFFIIFSGMLLLIFNKEMTYKQLPVFILPIFISLFLFYFLYFKPVYNELHSMLVIHWTNDEAAFLTISNFPVMLKETLYNLIKLKLPLPVFYLFLLINIIILFFQKNKKIIYLIILPIVFTFLANCMFLYPFNNRLLLFLLPLFIILYSQSILLLKENKILSVLIITLVIFWGINFIKFPYEYWIYIQSNSRYLYLLLEKNNNKLENVISVDDMYEYYSGKKSMFNDTHIFDKDFTKSEIPNYINNAQNGEYYIYIPCSDMGYMQGLKEYLNGENGFRIKEIYTQKSYDNTILAKIEK